MKKFFTTAAVLLIVSQLAAFTAFDKGKWQADIVVPDKPGQAEEFAVKELKYHLTKATGVEINVVKESEKSALPCHFFVGNTSAAKAAGIDKAKLAMDTRIVKTVSNGIIFIGGDRKGLKVGNQWSAACQGTLYAVYEYLENYLGVRWIWPGELGEVIPKQTKIEIGKIDISGQEPLVARRYRTSGVDKNYLMGWSTPEVRQAFQDAQELFLIRHRMGARENLFYGHAYSHYWRTYGKTHPEYFSLLPNGKREPLKGDPVGEYITMCVSNEAFQNQAIKDWRYSSARRKGALYYMPMVNACENDTPGMCTCEKCRSWDAKDPRFAKSNYWGKGKDPLTRQGRFHRLARVMWGEEGDEAKIISAPPSVSDRYAKFYMALLKKAKAIDPNARVAGYAYANYLEPPKETKLDKDIVLIHVAGIGFPYIKEYSDKFRQGWMGWKKAGIRDFVLRPNYMLMSGNFPANFGRIIADDFAWAFKNGMIGTNFDSLTGVFANQGPMIYTLVRIHRQPDFGYENAMKEYCAVFAPADKEVREYVDFWENFSKNISRSAIVAAGDRNKDRNGSISGGHSNFFLLAHEFYTPAVFAKAYAILDRASQKAAGNDLVLKRINFLRNGLKDAELTAKTSAAYRKWINAKAAKRPRPERVILSNEYGRCFKALVEFRKSVEADFVSNFGTSAIYENYAAGWGHKRINLKKKSK